MKTLLIATLLTLSTCATVAPAMTCAPTEAVYERLEVQYGEEVVMHLLSEQARVIEVWINQETETWTIFVTDTNGTSCLLTSGTNYIQYGLEPNL